MKHYKRIDGEDIEISEEDYFNELQDFQLLFGYCLQEIEPDKMVLLNVTFPVIDDIKPEHGRFNCAGDYIWPNGEITRKEDLRNE